MADDPPEERDDRGQFRKGVSGNPAGRPRKMPDPPRPLDAMLADELLREVTFEDANGTKRKGTQYEMICANIITRLVQAKPTEAIAVLKEFKALGVLQSMRKQQDEGHQLLQRLSREIIKNSTDQLKVLGERRAQQEAAAETDSAEDVPAEPSEDESEEDGEGRSPPRRRPPS